MDFMDSVDSANAKCNRVRSWYLYEQYKSLEKNQLDATLRLKNKTYQDRILRQEMSERRARRRLCDQFGLCESDPRLNKSIRSAPSKDLLNDDDLFESVCELHEEYEFENYEDNYSNASSKELENFTSVADTKQDYDDSVNSDLQNVKMDNMRDDMKGELDIVKQNIAENIALQLETMEENIKCLEKYTKLADHEDIPAIDNSTLNINRLEQDRIAFQERTLKTDYDNSVLRMWSKLVAFATKIIRLNHGNCYYDYSSQLLTAVLACDVLLRGVNKMCHILQPYVSPIKYCTSDSETSSIKYNKLKRKKSVNFGNFHKINQSIKYRSGNKNKHRRKLRNVHNKFNSVNEYKCCKSSFENYLNDIKYRGTSEPMRSIPKLTNDKYSEKSSIGWPENLVRGHISKENICNCHSLRKFMKPIIQLARYIESLLQDIDE